MLYVGGQSVNIGENVPLCFWGREIPLLVETKQQTVVNTTDKRGCIETHEINISDKKAQIVDTIPGWIHKITNTGKNDAVILLWANEIFDRENPDTIPEEV